MRGRDTAGVGRDERRSELLAAAIEVIRRDGPDATMEAMANAGGISKPILYRHFADREGLVAAITERALAELGAILDERMRTEGSAGPRRRVEATIDGFFEYIERDTTLYTFVVDNDMRHGSKATLAFTEQVSQAVAEAIRGGLASVGRDPAAAEAWGRAIVGMVHQAGSWWVSARPVPRATIVDQLVELVWAGVAGTAPPG